MPTSDSEDFESADEGGTDSFTRKKGRKNRLSSSNYSGSTQGSENEPRDLPPSCQKLSVKAATPPVSDFVYYAVSKLIIGYDP